MTPGEVVSSLMLGRTGAFGVRTYPFAMLVATPLALVLKDFDPTLSSMLDIQLCRGWPRATS